MSTELQQRYTAFAEMYALQKPPPVEREVKAEGVNERRFLFVILAASIFVSATRTIAEFSGNNTTGEAGASPAIPIVGIAAFVMLEGSLVYYSYNQARRMVRTDDTPSGHMAWLPTLGTVLSFVMLITANIHAVMRANGVTIVDWLNTVLLLLISLSAPVLAYIGGHLLGQQLADIQYEKRKARNEWEMSMGAWRDGLNRSWAKRREAELSVSVSSEPVSSPSPAALSGRPIGQDGTEDRGRLLSSSYGHDRTPDGQQKVIDHLNSKPEDAALSARQLGQLLNVGHNTANLARNAWKESRTS